MYSQNKLLHYLCPPDNTQIDNDNIVFLDTVGIESMTFQVLAT